MIKTYVLALGFLFSFTLLTHHLKQQLFSIKFDHMNHGDYIAQKRELCTPSLIVQEVCNVAYGTISINHVV
uniref:Uncharacterized protein n=1 Tax=Anguilla anguilla TaxID=7936 RepID=A0A0E9W4S9_ANGAN